MVLASHVIFGAYGFWLPNDPRGSWSDFVGAWELLRFGQASKTSTTVSVAAQSHDLALRKAAKLALKYTPVQFTGVQARAIGQAFGDYAEHAGMKIYACAILPEHIHLVLARHRLKVESLVVQLKSYATRQLIMDGIHPFGHLKDSNGRPPKCFARGEWKVFFNSIEDIDRAVRYVQGNPPKEGKRAQRWKFITRFAQDV